MTPHRLAPYVWIAVGFLAALVLVKVFPPQGRSPGVPAALPPAIAETIETETTLPPPNPAALPPPPPLDQALSAAIDRLPASLLKKSPRYRKALMTGQPVVCCDRPTQQAISIALAAQLDDHQRNAWLAACLAAQRAAAAHRGPEGAARLPEAWTYLAPKHDGRMPDSVAEAVYNLASDANLRLEALTFWNRLAEKHHRTDLFRHQEHIRHRGWSRATAPPTRETMPVWDR